MRMEHCKNIKREKLIMIIRLCVLCTSLYMSVINFAYSEKVEDNKKIIFSNNSDDIGHGGGCGEWH